MGDGNDEHADGDQSRHISCTLFVTTPVAGNQTVVIDRLTALHTAGAIDAVDIITVREQVLLAEGGDLCRTTDVGAAFEPLAEWTSGDLTSSVETSAETSRTGRSVRIVQPPAITLAIHQRGDLVAVFPCHDDERIWTVEECLDSLESARRLPPEFEPRLSAN